MARSILSGLLILVLASWGNAEKKDLVAVDVPSADAQFACDLYAKLAEKPGNVFVSPYSVSTALQMTWAGARGDTAAKMAAVLHLPNDPALVHPAVGELMKKLEAAGATKGIRVSIANRLYGGIGETFLPDFLSLIEKSYGGGLERVNFGAPDEAAKIINAWVEQKTEQKIKDLLTRDDVDRAVLVLVNAIYFKGDWETQFEKKLTADAVWLRPGDLVATTAALPPAHVKLMKRKGPARYFHGRGFQAVELPYAGKALSMVVFLPDKVDGLAEFEKSVNAGNLAKWMEALGDDDLTVLLPKFTMTIRYGEMEKTLADMGLPLRGDFSGMNGAHDLFISKVIHKAFVDVNEEGTEAAAATAVVMLRGMPPVFKADHPFFFLIRDKATGTILFMGRVVDPTAKEQG